MLQRLGLVAKGSPSLWEASGKSVTLAQTEQSEETNQRLHKEEIIVNLVWCYKEAKYHIIPIESGNSKTTAMEQPEPQNGMENNSYLALPPYIKPNQYLVIGGFNAKLMITLFNQQRGLLVSRIIFYRNNYSITM